MAKFLRIYAKKLNVNIVILSKFAPVEKKIRRFELRLSEVAMCGHLQFHQRTIASKHC